MKTSKYYIVLTLLFYSGVSCAQSTFFGLHWGMTVKQIQSIVKIKKELTSGNITTYSANSLPQNLSINNRYLLFVDKNKNLQKIIMLSLTNEDALGLTGKENYSSIKDALIKKYGKPQHKIESTRLEHFPTINNKFYSCLQIDDCGVWASTFSDSISGTSITLELKGKSQTDGFIVLQYESPSWTKLSEISGKDAL